MDGEGLLPAAKSIAFGLVFIMRLTPAYAYAVCLAGTVIVVLAITGVAANVYHFIGKIVADNIGGGLRFFLKGIAAGFSTVTGAVAAYMNVGAAAAIFGITGAGSNVTF